MNPQRLLNERGPVLDENGCPIPGYSTRSVRQYHRAQIHANGMRIKEWDWYQVSNDHLCLQFTYGHAAYVGQVDVMMFDFKTGEKIFDVGTLIPFALYRMRLDKDGEKDSYISYESKKINMVLETKNNIRRLSFSCNDGNGEIILKRKNPHSLVITVPFDEKKTQFYYNHKINCMSAAGYVNWQGKRYVFNERDSFGLLDWGRGVWPFHNEWYWSNATGYVDGQMLGFNLGCGFGNPSLATENIVFYKGNYSKYGNVIFECDKTDYNKPWHIYDEDGRIDLILYPVYDRLTKTKVLWIDNCTHQMFGGFKGSIILDDGTKIELTGKELISFAEHAVNNW